MGREASWYCERIFGEVPRGVFFLLSNLDLVHPGVWTVVAAVPAVLAALGSLFCVAVLFAAADFVRAARKVPREHPAPPPVSILKPVKSMQGDLDEGLVEALRSHCTQRYPAEVELLLAVRTLEDPAVPALRGLAREFPRMRIEVVETPEVLGQNGKVSNLLQLLPQARFGHLLISDADIAVGPDYLARVMAPFAEERTGLVTAGYRGRTHPAGRPTPGSRLEALTIATDFYPGVLMARLTERGVRFALGSTLLVSREALEKAGGLEPLLDVLADDHALGRRVAAAGYRVVLSQEAVSTAVSAYSLGGFARHQLRWLRTVQDVRPWSYAGLVLTHPVPWALLYVLASGASLLSVVLLLLALACRMAVAIRVGYGLLGDLRVLRDLALLPLRDCAALALWVWSYTGKTVEWRGERFRVRRGRLERVDGQARPPGGEPG